MAWSRVQSASTAATVSAISSVAATYGTNLTSGTTLICAVSVATQTGASTEVSGVSDGNGHSFTLVGRKFTTPLVDVSLWMLSTPSGDAGTTPTITATLGSGTGNMAILIQEVSGLSGVVDGTLGSLAGSGTGTTGSPTYSSGAASEYLVSVYGDDGGPLTYTKPAALTADTNSLNTQTYADLALAYGNSTGGTEAGSWSLSGSSAEWSVLLVAFELTAGTVSGIPATMTLAAPAGTVTASSTISGSVASLTFAAPAGVVSTTANVAGAVASLTWTALTGSVTVTPPGAGTATYHGLFTRGYLQYTDLGSGLTLVARPGQSYYLTPASGQADLTSPPNDGWWTTAGGGGGGGGGGQPRPSVPGLAIPGAFTPGAVPITASYGGPFSSVPGFAGPGAATPGFTKVTQQHPAMAVFRPREDAAEVPPAHLSGRDLIRWKQRKATQQAHVRMARRAWATSNRGAHGRL